MKRPLRATAAVAFAVAVAAAGGAYMVLLGGYDVAATEPHLRATVWVLDTAMRSSVRARSDHLDVPPLEDLQRIAAGAAVYRQQCETCHGPGSRHAQNPVDKALIQRGPAKTLCAPACHHPPHVPQGWSADAAWSKIIGPGHGM